MSSSREPSRGSSRRGSGLSESLGLEFADGPGPLPSMVIEEDEPLQYEKTEPEGSVGFFGRLASVVGHVGTQLQEQIMGDTEAEQQRAQAAAAPYILEEEGGNCDRLGALPSFYNQNTDIVVNDDMREIMMITSAAALPYTRAQAGLDMSSPFGRVGSSATCASGRGSGRGSPRGTRDGTGEVLSPTLTFTRPSNRSEVSGQDNNDESCSPSPRGSSRGAFEMAMAGASFKAASRLARLGQFSMRDRSDSGGLSDMVMRHGKVISEFGGPEEDKGPSGWMEIHGGHPDTTLLASKLKDLAEAMPESMRIQIRITPGTSSRVEVEESDQGMSPVLAPEPGGLSMPVLETLTGESAGGLHFRPPRLSDASSFTAIEAGKSRPPTSTKGSCDGGRSRPAFSRTQSEPVMQSVPVFKRRNSIELIEWDGNYFQRYAEADAMMEEEMHDRREFLVALAASLHKFGAATHLTEALIKACTEKLLVPAQCSAFPSLLLISFNSKEMDPSKSQTRSLALVPSMNLDKLDAADELAVAIIAGDISFLAARDELQAILLKPKNYTRLQLVLAYALAAWSASILFYGGSWVDGLFSLLLGSMASGISWMAGMNKAMGKIEEFLVAFICSLTARFIHRYINRRDTCFFAMILSAILWYLPGLTITTAVTELANKSLVSGSSRLFSATIAALQLGFGLAIGSRAVLWDAEGDNTPCDFVMPTWFAPIGFFGLTSSLMVLSNLPLTSNSVGVYGSAAAGFMMSMWLETKPYITSDTRSFVCAFAVGCVGGLWSRITRRNNLSTIVCGILLLVPGGIGVRGVQAFMRDDVISGLQLGFKMFTVALSITVGLLVAKLAVSPVGKLSRFSMLRKNFNQPTLF